MICPLTHSVLWYSVWFSASVSRHLIFRTCLASWRRCALSSMRESTVNPVHVFYKIIMLITTPAVCEFDKFGVDAHLCKLRNTPVARFYKIFMSQNLISNSNNIMKIKIHSSCEIEYFVETHLCKLCVILRSRVLRVVCPH